MIREQGIYRVPSTNSRTIFTVWMIVFILAVGSFMSQGKLYSADMPAHVIYDVEWVSDHRASLELSWSNENGTEPIMISSWKKIDDNTLEVRYNYGDNVHEGFDKRTITVSEMSFPCVIRLVENKADAGKELFFPDLGTNVEKNNSIKHLYDLGIIEGYPDGTFKPSGNVTRAEFSKMLFYSAKMSYALDSPITFTDVNATHWADDIIYTLATKKIVEGRGNGIFDPNGTITISEVLAIIDRTFTIFQSVGHYGYELDNHWSNENFISLVSSGIVKAGDMFYQPYQPTKIATREECALLLSRVLEQYHETVD